MEYGHEQCMNSKGKDRFTTLAKCLERSVYILQYPTYIDSKTGLCYTCQQRK